MESLVVTQDKCSYFSKQPKSLCWFGRKCILSKYIHCHHSFIAL